MNNNESENVLYVQIKEILNTARAKAYTAVNFAMVNAYWLVGRQIVQAQDGNTKAKYGSSLLKYLSERLTSDFGKGFDESNLRYIRQFYLTFQNCDALRHELSWSHYRKIMKIESVEARNFYIDECIKSNWNTRQLERQTNTHFYERLLSSRNKEKVSKEIYTKESNASPDDIIKDPYILEFLGLKHNSDLLESDLEKALITHIQKFLLELGRGFTFEARQKRISFDGEDYYIDLVFYNYILKCFVLLDLKTGRLTHQDIGQMQMYVNYYTRELMNEGDNPPIGLILCADKSESVVRYTLAEDNKQIFTSKYRLYLPTEEELSRELENEKKLLVEEYELRQKSGGNE